jgi:DNA invertase Pin-like site-specific DNA recombinase
MSIIGYIRVSTDQQVESGLGLEAQEQAIYSWAEEKNMPVRGMYRDNGFSGSLGLDKRPGILQALATIAKKEILLVAKRDRLGRDPFILHMIESEIKKRGASLISIRGEGTGFEDANSIMMRRMIDVFAEHERNLIGERTKAALRVKAQRGERVGQIPYGYQLAEDKIHLEPNIIELHILLKIHELREQKYKIREIVQYLNEAKLLNRNDIPWHRCSIHRMMHKGFNG